MRALVVFGIASAALPLLGQVTYTREISRIFQAKCAICHRPNDIAPMSLETYEDAVNWAPDIKRVVETNYMPPWKPVEGHGRFNGSFALTADERQQILDWTTRDTPRGDEADMPPAAPPRSDWSLGDPDLVIKMKDSFSPPRGRDVYRCFVIPTGMEEDKYVTAMDIVPGNRKSVHHVIVYLDSSGEAEKLDGKDGTPGYECYGGPGVPLFEASANGIDLVGTLGGWAPGARAAFLPEGIGMRLDKRARIVMQVHYYTNVGVDPDRTSVGLYFSKKPIEKQLFFLPLVQPRLNIPAGSPDYTAHFSVTVPPFFDVKVINIFPHMHLLGREIKVEWARGDKRESLVYIDNWDFNWQGAYNYTEPVALPAFTNLSMACKYDNSLDNPRNPSNPPKLVTWGESTEDEMCVAFMGVVFGK